MAKEKNIEQLVSATLDALDGLQKKQPAPGFYDRLQDRLSEDTPNRVVKMNWMPKVAAAAVALLVIANAYTYINSRKHMAMSDATVLESVGKAYYWETSSLYD